MPQAQFERNTKPLAGDQPPRHPPPAYTEQYRPPLPIRYVPPHRTNRPNTPRGPVPPNPTNRPNAPRGPAPAYQNSRPNPTRGPPPAYQNRRPNPTRGPPPAYQNRRPNPTRGPAPPSQSNRPNDASGKSRAERRYYRDLKIEEIDSSFISVGENKISDTAQKRAAVVEK
ncbi:MAG: hypothetical protein Q9191_005884 [Dirinaria sp. TL-2023a]